MKHKGHKKSTYNAQSLATRIEAHHNSRSSFLRQPTKTDETFRQRKVCQTSIRCPKGSTF